MYSIKTEGMRFTDSKGRERIFNGVNVVDKSTYDEENSKFGFDMNENVLKDFASKGINLIRLGFTWNKMEPKPGKYNDAYIDSLAQIIDNCAKYGIYVFLDMHQDLYSPMCYGDGAPDWATLTDGIKPKKIWLVWADVYFLSRACHRAFDNFWNNEPVYGRGLQDRFADCWKYIISRLGDKEAVIGFDFFNEPFPGTDGGKAFRRLVAKGTADVLLTGKFGKAKFIKNAVSRDRVEKILGQVSFPLMRSVTGAADELVHRFDLEKYSPFLNRMGKAARQVNKDKILFMENGYYSNTSIPFSAPKISVDGIEDENQAFTPHGYDIMVDTPLYKFASAERAGGIFAEHKRSQERLGVPVVVGEWGGFGGSKDEMWLEHIVFLLNLFDSNKWSNTYWAFMEGFLQSPLMKVFVRPHPFAVNGVIESYAYDNEKKVFTLSFESMKKGESEIYVHTAPSRVTLDGEDAKYKTDGNIIVISTAKGAHNITVEF
ncbi:MAG: cellulase family glycosylhydrolase [Clostridia bacterium]|nr:cellulase family glycosylhydrolase [Clostridia bacterium]